MGTFTAQLLKGKTAFIAGGSSGINLGIAHGLAEAGASIALISRHIEKVEAAVAELETAGYEASGSAVDVRDYPGVEQALRDVHAARGSIDIVVSGAAGNFLAPAIGMSANAFKTVVDIDLMGTFHVLRASYQFLRRPGASVISISAGQAVNPTAFQSHVCVAKAGINMLTRCLAMEWGAVGLRVNAISPGPIRDTEGMTRLTPTLESEAVLKRVIPLGDYGEKRDIADLAVYLCSDSAKYITGAIFDCDGGFSLAGGGALAPATIPART